MKNILLVAIREYKQIASTRGFWVMLLVLPVVIGITQVAGRFFRPQLELRLRPRRRVRPVRNRHRSPPQSQLSARRTRRLLRLRPALGPAVRETRRRLGQGRALVHRRTDRTVRRRRRHRSRHGRRQTAPSQGRSRLRRRPAQLTSAPRCRTASAPPRAPMPSPPRSPMNCKARSTHRKASARFPSSSTFPPRPAPQRPYACGPMARPTPR